MVTDGFDRFFIIKLLMSYHHNYLIEIIITYTLTLNIPEANPNLKLRIFWIENNIFLRSLFTRYLYNVVDYGFKSISG